MAEHELYEHDPLDLDPDDDPFAHGEREGASGDVARPRGTPRPLTERWHHRMLRRLVPSLHKEVPRG